MGYSEIYMNVTIPRSSFPVVDKLNVYIHVVVTGTGSGVSIFRKGYFPN